MADRTRVSIVSTLDRAEGVAISIDLLEVNPAAGKDVLLKPNFNTADPYPGSTHNDTLEALIRKLQHMGASTVTVGDRCGPGDTADVMRAKGIPELCKYLGAGLINFEAMPSKRWEHIKPEQSHWLNGFHFARPVLEAGCVVNTCCLKTHGFGGVFTISLKNTVGMINGKNMTELHASLISMRKMIAEANLAYSPGLIVVDAIDAFVDGGPMQGKLARAGLFIGGTDRVAVDAVGIAVLKMLGANRAIMGKKIFEHDQIARAAELGLGVRGPDDIDLVYYKGPDGSDGSADKSREAAERISEIMEKEG